MSDTEALVERAIHASFIGIGVALLVTHFSNAALIAIGVTMICLGGIEAFGFLSNPSDDQVSDYLDRLIDMPEDEVIV